MVLAAGAPPVEAIGPKVAEEVKEFMDKLPAILGVPKEFLAVGLPKNPKPGDTVEIQVEKGSLKAALLRKKNIEELQKNKLFTPDVMNAAFAEKPLTTPGEMERRVAETQALNSTPRLILDDNELAYQELETLCQCLAKEEPLHMALLRSRHLSRARGKQLDIIGEAIGLERQFYMKKVGRWEDDEHFLIRIWNREPMPRGDTLLQ